MRKILAAAILLAVLASAPALASVEGYVDGGYTVGDTTYPLMKGVFHSPSNLPMRFFYTDGFFAEDPYTYNTHLAAASLCMAIAGMYADWSYLCWHTGLTATMTMLREAETSSST